jgi:hypothetical protein
VAFDAVLIKKAVHPGKGEAAQQNVGSARRRVKKRRMDKDVR